MSGRSVLLVLGVCGALVPGVTPTAVAAVAPLPPPPSADAPTTTTLPPPPDTEAPPAASTRSEPLPPPPGSEAPPPKPPPKAAPVQRPTQPVNDAAWNAVSGRQVVIDTDQGPIAGELIGVEGDTLVVLKPDGQVVTIPKVLAKGVRVADPSPAPAPASPPTVTTVPTPAEPTPPATGPSPAPAEPTAGTEPPAEPTAAEPSEDPATAMADLDPAPAEDEGDPEGAKEGAKEDPKKDPEKEEELSKAEQRRKERREKREHALLGAFTMQGATYSHWRGDGINSGHASYAMDFGVGANLTRGFGMYAVGGGLFGTKLDDGATKGNYGHIAALFAFGGKYYYSTVGAGVAFSRLRYSDDTLDKDRGLAMPFKLVGKIPLPKKLYIGLGLSYEFAAVRKFGRFVNAIGGQIVFGRW